MQKKGETSGGHTALYRKYRSRSLDEIIAQPQVTGVLKRSLEQGRIAHAYLLTGPKGTGKTSIARILAHEINGIPYSDDTNLDIIEIDAASNNSVEDVRDLREKVQIAPVAAKRKVYIIDEVHMLSKSAFNALLKTLEEPPAHVLFILATTDLHKLPATIVSRTQHFALHSISRAELAGQLKKIADNEGTKISDDALDAIAQRGDGSFRNSISLLDQLSNFADDKDGVTLELVESTLGLAPTTAVENLVAAVDSRDVKAVVDTLDTLEKQGIQPTILADQLVQYLRARLADQPSYVTLLDSLLDVAGSSHPHLKLVTVLVSAIKPKTAAARATTLLKPQPTIIEAPVIIVEQTTPAQQPQATAEPAQEPEPRPKVAARQDTPAPTPTVAVVAAGPRPEKIDMVELMTYSKKQFIALHSVLTKCDFLLEGDTLTLYTGLKFNKTKLDQAKYLTQLHEALGHVGFTGLTIVTVPTAKPPTDENLAKLAAIMGGGQEISLDETKATA